ncbi:MAG: hypothetical protein ACRDSN_11435 [Pseudonocardiaceae bacterium]
MTVDVIALCREQPDIQATLAALLEAGPGLRLRPIERGGLVQLCDDGGAPLVTVEGPSLVQVPGKVERLLGTEIAPPVWWVELRARDHHPEALRVARRFAGVLAQATGGVTWPNR